MRGNIEKLDIQKRKTTGVHNERKIKFQQQTTYGFQGKFETPRGQKPSNFRITGKSDPME